MSRVVVTKELVVAQTRTLKMPGLRRVFEALGRQAREEGWSHEEYLHEVLAAEQLSRDESAVKHRIREAHFPELKTLDGFDFNAVEGVTARQAADLARGDWIARAENVILVGPIGTGKTHLAIALGLEAAKQRRRVLFARAADLVRSLVEARDARDVGRVQRRLNQIDVLVLDELGFVPFDRTGAELLFNLLADRYERRSIVVTSNLPFSEWVRTFGGDEKLTTAMLDRLAHHATVISTKGKSYRMRKRGQEIEPAQEPAAPTPPSLPKPTRKK
jgi:DNA replication protein DnaC